MSGPVACADKAAPSDCAPVGALNHPSGMAARTGQAGVSDRRNSPPPPPPPLNPGLSHPGAGHPARPHRGGAHPSPRSGTRPLAARVLARCLLLCTLIAPGLAQAQDVTLSGNTGETTSGNFFGAGDRDYAQQFSTGNREFGYVVNSVDIKWGQIGSSLRSSIPTVSIVEASSNRPTGTTAGTLTRSANLAQNANNTFTSSTGITLKSNTAYFLVIDLPDTSTGRRRLTQTSSNAAGARSDDPGWSVGDVVFRDSTSTGAWTRSSFQSANLQFALKGMDAPDPPPTITSIERQAPMQEETGADRLTWRVTFSEPVQNRARRVFNWAVSGPTGTTITQTDVGGTDYQTVLIVGSGDTYMARESDVWDVTVSGGNLASYTGDIALTLTGAAQELTGVQDTANQPLTNPTPTGTNDNSYTRVKNRIESIERLSFDGAQDVTTDAEFTDLTWRVTFTNPVQAIRRETLRDSWTITGPDSVTIEQTRVSDEVWAVTVSGRDLETHAGTVTLGLNVSPSPPQLFVQGGQLINATPLGVNENTYTLTRAPVPVAGVRLLRCDGAGEPAGCYDGQPVAEDAGTLDLTVVIDLPRSWTEDPDFAPSEVSGAIGFVLRSLGAGETPDATATEGADFEAVRIDKAVFDTLSADDIVGDALQIPVTVSLLDDTVEEGEERLFLSVDNVEPPTLTFKGQGLTRASLQGPLTAPEDAIVIFDGDAGETSTAPPAPMAPVPGTEIWSATLTVKNPTANDFGCFSGTETSNTSCANSAVLNDNDFEIDGTTYQVTNISISRGRFSILFFPSFSNNLSALQSLILTVDGMELPNENTMISIYESASPGITWTAGQEVALKFFQGGPPPSTDTTAPTVSITGLPRAAEGEALTGPATALITFSEPVAGFTLDDIDATNATLSNFGAVLTDTPNTVWSVRVTPIEAGGVALDIPAGAATDAAGNENTVAPRLASVYRPTAPTVTSITRQSPTAELTNADSLTWRVTFSEAVTGVDAADFVLTGTTATLSVAPFFERVYDLTATGGNLATLDGPVTLGFATGQDISGVSTSLPLSDTAPTTGTNENSYTLDNTGPRVNAFTRFAPTVSPTNADTLTWRVSFSEPVEKLDVTDFLLMGTTATLAAPVPAGDVPNAWDITASGGDLASLNATVILGAGGGLDIADAAGNALTSAMPVPNEDRYVVDNTAPRTVSILRQDPMTQLTNADQLTWRVTFSEAVREVDAADFTSPAGVMRTVVPVAPGTALGSVAWDVRFSDDPAVSGDPLASASGNVSINYDQRAVSIEDLAGNVMSDTSPTGTAEPTYTLNNTAPVVSIEAGADVDKGTAAVFTLRRTGATTAALTVMVSVTQTGSVIDTTALPTSVTFGANEATATLSVATMDDGMADSVGTVIVEIEEPDPVSYVPADPPRAAVAVTGRPAVEISDVPATSTGPFTAVIGFSKPVSGFTVADITATNATLSGFAADSTAGTTPDTVWTVLVTPTADGAVTLDIAADVATDTAGNGNVAAPQATSTYDGTDPTVVSIVRDSPTSSPTNAGSLAWLVRFSEEVENITEADFMLDGTTATLIVVRDPGLEFEAYRVIANDDGDLADLDAVVSLSFAEDQDITDLAGRSLTNTAPTGTNDNTYTVDNTAPGVASIVRHAPTAEVTGADELTWRVGFDEAVENVDAADFAVTGTTATVSAVAAVADETGVYEVSVAGGDLAELTATVTLGFASGASIADRAGNELTDPVPTGANQGYEVNNEAPIVSIAGGPAVDEGDPATFTLTRTVTDGLTTEALTVMVSVTEETGSVIDPATIPTTVTIGAGQMQAEFTVATVDDAVDDDVDGESSPGVTVTLVADSADPVTYQVATATATVTVNDDDTRGVTVSDSELTVAESGGMATYTVELASEPTAAVTITPASSNAEVTVSPATLTFTSANWQTPQTVTVEAMPDDDDADDRVTISHGVAGGDYEGFAAPAVTVDVVEIRLPQVSVEGPDLAREGDDLVFILTRTGGGALEDEFEELTVQVAVTQPIGDGDVIDIDNAPKTVTFGAQSRIGAGAETAEVTIGTRDDNVADSQSIVVLTVLNDRPDENGDIQYEVGKPPRQSVVMSDSRPDSGALRVISIERQTPADTPTNADSLTWRVTFSGNVRNVDDTDFTLTGTTATLTVAEATAATVFDVTATDGDLADLDGEVALGFAPGQDITDTAATPNALSDTMPTRTNDNRYLLDNTAPSVMIGDVPPTSTGPFTATITFSEPVSGLVQSDITVSNATLSNLSAIPGATQWTVAVTPTADGPVTLAIGSDVAVDAAGNGNAAAPQASSTYTAPIADPDAPTVVSIVRQTPADSPTNADSLTWRVTFSGNVQNVDDTDFTLTGTTATLTVVAATAATVFDVTATGGDLADRNGEVVLGFAPGQDITDTAATPNALGVTTPTGTNDNRYVVDNTAPTVTIDDVPPTSTGPFTATITFSEPVSGLVASDITVSNATLSDLNAIPGATQWTVTVTPTADGPVTLAIGSDVAIDAAGNGNAAAPQASSTYAAPIADPDAPPIADPNAPTVVSIVRQTPAASPTNADTLTWRVTFSRDVQNVDPDDFMLVGSTANLMVSPMTAASRYEVTASGGDLAELDGTVILGFAAGQNITDTAATPNALRVATPSGANDNHYVVDNTAPTVTIDYSPGPGEVIALIQFSEPVTGFEATDITAVNETLLDFFPIPDENRWVAHYQPIGNAVVTLNIEPNVVFDAAGNGNTADSPPAFTDTPTGNTVPTFSAAALTRNVAENAVPGTGVGAPIPAATDADGDALSYRMLGVDASSFDFNPINRQISTRADIDYDFETRNSYSVQIEARDGNGGTAAVAVTIQLTDVDEPPVTPVTPVTPAVPTVANGIGDQTAAAGAAFNFTVPADTFAVTDGAMLSYSATRGDGTALPGWLSFNTATQTFSGTPGAANAGVLTVRVTATNPAGASANTEFDLTVTVQDAATAPTVLSIERQNPANTPTNADTLTWRVTFSGEVRNVDQTDFTLTGTTATLMVSPVTASSSYDVTASGGNLAELDGTVILGFASEQNITDTAATPNALLVTTPSGANDNRYVVDNTAPTVTIDYSPGTGEVIALIQFSEPVAGFTATDITVDNGTLLDFFPIPDENLWVAHYRSVGNAVVTLDLGADVVEDLAGNVNTAASQLASTVNAVPTSRVAALKRSVAGNAAPGTGGGTEQSPVISVADAQVQEGPGATLDFVISLSRPVPPGSRPLLIPYRTGNGSAVSGQDYIGVSGRAYIRPGETGTILSIQVLDDDHDEGSETMTLTIVAPSGGRIGRGTATGTIVNSDPMPDAWLSRFGRTASDQTAEAIRRRMEGGARESHLTVGGRRLDTLWTNAAGPARPHSLAGASASAPASLLRMPAAGGWALQASGATGWHGFGNPAAAGGSGSLSGPAPDPALPQSPGMGTAADMNPPSGMGPLPTAGTSAAMSRAPTGPGRGSSAGGFHLPAVRDLLLQSSFFYSQAADSDRGPVRRLSTWGEAATSRFRGAEGALNVDGELATAVMGVDAEWGRWLAGVAVSHSDGAGGYSRTGSEGGTVASALTAVNPYVHYRRNERTSFWATLGYGSGSLTLQPANADAPLETGLRNAMAAVGGRGVLSMFDRGPGRFELALRSDALLTHTASDATVGLVAGAGATGRVRLLLEGTGSLPAFGGTLEPRLEAGLRHDAGDAESGAGFEIGGGLGWRMGPLSLDFGARTLLAHGNEAYGEWGYNAAVEYRPGADGRGLRLRLGTNRGADRSGVQQLWSQQTAAGFARPGGMPLEQRLEAEIGFGLGTDRLWYPYAAADAGTGSRAMRLGLKLTSGPTLEAGFEFGRREPAPGNPPEEAVLLQGRIRF